MQTIPNWAVRFLVVAMAGCRLFAAGGDPVFRIVQSDDAVAVQKYVAGNKNAVNARDEDGWTPLIHAALLPDTRMMKVLLMAGADPNATNELGHSAMLLAAGDTSKLRLLLAHKGDLNL